MPNFATFNINPSDLKTAIYGSDTNGVDQAIKVDTSGMIFVAGATITAGTIDAVSSITTIEGGTINTVNTVDVVSAVTGATVTTIQGGTLGSVTTVSAVTTIEGGTINTVNTVDVVSAVTGATVTTIQGGTLGSVTTVSAVTTIEGGTINTVNTVDVVSAVTGATVTTIQGGTINTVNTIDVVSAVTGATVTTIQGGTINEVTTVTAISQANFVEDDVLNSPAANTTYTEVASGQLRRDSQFFNTYTYFVTNQTANTTLDVRIEVSPDDTNWFNDTEVTSITQETTAIVPKRFGKYTRVMYKVTSDATTINVWFNAQG